MNTSTIQSKVKIQDARLDVLLKRYQVIRAFTDKLCESLENEDYVIQSMQDVSPTRWHIAHTSWFFETFILKNHCPDYQVFHKRFNYLFNSYYNAVGDQHCRDRRGVLSRPTVDQIYKYRSYIDEWILVLFDKCRDKLTDKVLDIFEVGLNHEQQHQELMLMDIKHVFSCNPLKPIYKNTEINVSGNPPAVQWIDFKEGLHEVGHRGEGFAYDNETPAHKVYLNNFQLASRLVTNGEYKEFMSDKGYSRAEFWLSDAWSLLKKEKWQTPLYWEFNDGEWWQFTLTGMKKVNDHEPVCHVSFYEADAYARWAGKRLPTEFEWEVVAKGVQKTGHFVEDENYHPIALNSENDGDPIKQLYGYVWEWTASPYMAYPGFKAAQGALGEYNGKFMCNQMVLRGGCCATSVSHIRPTYRNFFMPYNRWQFSGFRLAQ